MRDGCAHRILSVHLDPLPSAAVTTSVPRRPRPRPSLRSRLAGPRPSPRALILAASIGWRHAAADPVRALLLAWRALPAPLRGWLRLAGPYGPATVLWGTGERDAALAALAASPRRLGRLRPGGGPASRRRRPPWTGSRMTTRAIAVLAARLAWREGQLTEALGALDGAHGIQARRLRTILAAEQALLARPVAARPRRSAERVPGRVLHLVTDALPATSAGYTIRTHEIAVAQRAAGLDPHVATRCGYPVTQGRLDGRRLVVLDGVPYHRLLPWLMPAPAQTPPPTWAWSSPPG